MRIGLFGGTFDPVHVGHLIAAECCREQAALDRVIFMPAAISPHKIGRPITPAESRVDMLRLAAGGHDGFTVSTDELDRGGVSYTVDTLGRLRAAHPEDDLLLILGPDAIREFPTWREPARILELVDPLIVEREALDGLAGLSAEPRLVALFGRDRLARILERRVVMPAIGIRASELRSAVASGRSIRYRTPRSVERYIATHGLYRTT
jgi:nicotinate-nucleotide adenylyltransferase